MSKLGFKPNSIEENTGQAVASKGTDIFNDTDTHTGKWKSFTVLIQATVNAITDDGGTASTVPTATALPAGSYVSANGYFTSIDLTSGMVAMARA